ncbi:MAG: DUF749 family protein [Thermoplasmata archaeon]
MFQKATVVMIDRARKIPTEFQGLIHLRSGMEHREHGEEELVAILHIGRENCYYAIFLDEQTDLRVIELKLSRIHARLTKEARRKLESALMSLT